jgi:hypothetical protein
LVELDDVHEFYCDPAVERPTSENGMNGGRLESEAAKTKELADMLRGASRSIAGIDPAVLVLVADRLERLQKDAHEWEVTARLHADEGWRDQVERSNIAIEVQERLLKEGRVTLYHPSAITYALDVSSREADTAHTFDELGDKLIERLLSDNRAIDPVISGDLTGPTLMVECMIRLSSENTSPPVGEGQ